MLWDYSGFGVVRVIECKSCRCRFVFAWDDDILEHWNRRAEKKCRFPDGLTVKPDGENELDPCSYKVVEEYSNVTVRVLRCRKCGHTELEWERQDNTEEVTE